MSIYKIQDSKNDKTLFWLILGFLLFGVVMIFDASAVAAAQDFKDKFYYLRLQSLWAFLGIFLMIGFSLVNYHFWQKISVFLFLGALSLLILVLIPGIGLKYLGGRRWLGIGEFSFQPSELAKLAFIIYLSSLLEKKKRLSTFLLLVGLVTVLLMLEPDLGTSLIVIATAFFIYFASGAHLLELLLVLFLGLAGVAGFIFTAPYRLSRLKVFLNPEIDPEGASYHLRQILLALGSGGLWGRGLGQSRQKYLFLPETATDSVFAVIGEEMGFIGSLAVLLFLLIMIIRGLKIAQEAPDKFGQLLGVGIAGSIFVQSFLNLASMVSLVPLTGVPLPLISYGRSSLLVTLSGLGILLNISRQRVIKKKKEK